jgi:ferredoxin-type protein NapH
MANEKKKKSAPEAKFKNVRTAIAAVIFVVLCVGLFSGIATGTLCGFGWDTFSLLCPLGALETMIATKTGAPRALITLVVMAALVFIFGRAFCSYVCPTTLLNRVRRFFQSPKERKAKLEAKHAEIKAVSEQEIAALKAGVSVGEGVTGGAGHVCGACGACKPKKHGKVDSRHGVLLGALASTAIFGFPVFCLVCPVGLSFATVLVVWRGFSAGDTTWSLLIIPALLIVEVFLLRKWCTRFCPLSALMNLVGRFSRTFVPEIDDTACLETSKGVSCSKCAMACEWDINIRHPEFGELDMRDCTRCRACIDVCPTQAISMPAVNKRSAGKLNPFCGGKAAGAGAKEAVVVLDEKELIK